MATLKICPYPGCSNTVISGYCPEHKAGTRDMARQRFYESVKWARIRNAQRMRQPLCEDCLAEDRVTLMQEVHHADNNWRNCDPSNLVSLCKSCHSKMKGG
jgi:5-methylcytosine-specific restriction protein A